jgi:hypothetical protein
LKLRRFYGAACWPAGCRRENELFALQRFARVKYSVRCQFDVIFRSVVVVAGPSAGAGGTANRLPTVRGFAGRDERARCARRTGQSTARCQLRAGEPGTYQFRAGKFRVTESGAGELWADQRHIGEFGTDDFPINEFCADEPRADEYRVGK